MNEVAAYWLERYRAGQLEGRDASIVAAFADVTDEIAALQEQARLARQQVDEHAAFYRSEIGRRTKAAYEQGVEAERRRNVAGRLT